MPPSLTLEQAELARRQQEKFEQSDKLHSRYRDQWDRSYKLYKGFTDWKTNSGNPRDYDSGLASDKRDWGADLTVRLIFTSIETLQPRMVSHRPRMLILPKDDVAAGNVENMRALIDAQQRQIQYELRLGTSIKNALLFGIGPQKNYWRTETHNTFKIVPSLRDPRVMVRQPAQELVFDDPMAEAINPYDFLWAPYATDMDNCDYVIHRLWMTDEQIMQRIKTGAWCDPQNPLVVQLTAEDVRSSGSPHKWDEINQERMTASGLGDTDRANSSIHEVWECHSRDEVVVMLDRQYPVVQGPCPYNHGQLPFSICRPTEDPHQMVGISEAEMLADLQEELSTLRGQRRDAATMALNAPMAYQEGLVDPADLKWEPNAAMPVTGDPGEVLHQFQFRDIPQSGYQEEQAMKSDAETVSGISEQLLGQNTTQPQTATGMQVVQQNANARIDLKVRRCEVELIGRAAYQWGRMNQQHILENKTIPIPKPPEPGQPANQVWATRTLSPGELAGEFLYVPEGGSTAPLNRAQELQEAQMLWNMFRDNPQFDQRMLAGEVARKAMVPSPEAFLTPPEPGIPSNLPQVLEQLGVPKEDIQIALQVAQQQAQAAQAQDTGRAQSSQQPQPEGQLPEGVPA